MAQRSCPPKSTLEVRRFSRPASPPKRSITVLPRHRQGMMAARRTPFTCADAEVKIAAVVVALPTGSASQVSVQLDEDGRPCVPVFAFCDPGQPSIVKLAAPCPEENCSHITKGKLTEGQLVGNANKHLKRVHKKSLYRLMSVRAPGTKISNGGQLLPRAPRRAGVGRSAAAQKRRLVGEAALGVVERGQSVVVGNLMVERESTQAVQRLDKAMPPALFEQETFDLTIEQPAQAVGAFDANAWVCNLVADMLAAQSQGQDPVVLVKAYLAESMHVVFSEKELGQMLLDTLVPSNAPPETGPVPSPQGLLETAAEMSPTTAFVIGEAPEQLPCALSQCEHELTLEERLMETYFDGDFDNSWGI